MPLSSFIHAGRPVHFHDVKAAVGCDAYGRMPYVARVIAENLLRRAAQASASEALGDLIDTRVAAGSGALALHVPRVILPDSSGIPVLLDLAALRGEIARRGMDPGEVGPKVPIDFIVDHSLQVDFHGMPTAIECNLAKEIDRNAERYSFLKWAQRALGGVRIYPPGSGIIHQIHLEQIAKVTLLKEGDHVVAYPDFALGGDSHTTMVNALGVLGWGVGGIEIETVVLGQPYILPKPEFVGVRLSGSLRAGVSTTDLALTATRILREAGVVGSLLEFYGEAAAGFSIPDRATLANMAPEYGATTGFWPVDNTTLSYLALTGRAPEQIALVEAHCRAAGLFRENAYEDIAYDRVIDIDLGTIGRSISGPGKPHFSRSPVSVPDSFRERTGIAGTDPREGDVDVPDGAIVLAAITSCTNTANPSVMISAGLLAQKAVALGLTVPAWVKTSLAPGSRAVTEYLQDAALLKPLEALGFGVIGYGCTTCGGKSGPLLPVAVEAVERHGRKVASVLSGNRNFDGRIHKLIPANYLCSPALVVAYALAGTILLDLDRDPIGTGADGSPVFLQDIWPEDADVRAIVERFVTPKVFASSTAFDASTFAGWAAIDAPDATLFPWDRTSQYIIEPPFFQEDARGGMAIEKARVLGVFDDGLTTDHISPSGEIPLDSMAGRYLVEHGIAPEKFNTYVGRRANHHVMTRGTYANIRLRNRLVPELEGGWTRHFPDGQTMSIFDAAMRYSSDGVPVIVLAGKDFGSGSSRDWAAKGQSLLGVRAIVAQSFERIHRSNLIGLGIVPLLFEDGRSLESLELDGSEVYSFEDLRARVEANASITVRAERADGTTTTFSVRADARSRAERDLLLSGGIFIGARESFIERCSTTIC